MPSSTSKQEYHDLANTLALKYGQAFRDKKVIVHDWDLAIAGAHDATRNAELEYYIFCACMEISRGLYARGYNDCAWNNYVNSQRMSK